MHSLYDLAFNFLSLDIFLSMKLSCMALIEAMPDMELKEVIAKYHGLAVDSSAWFLIELRAM